jgi:GNAT superfamily N-acetyltransferase
MIALSPDRFASVAPLFDAYWGLRPGIYSVIEGRQAGRIFADDVERPRTALLLGDWCYLAGDADNEAFNEAFVRDVLGDPARRSSYSLIFAAPEPWQAQLATLLVPLKGERYARSLFRLDVDAFRALPARPLPAGYAVQPLDARTALEAGGIPELWGSVEHFMVEGVGTCVLQGDTFVGSSQTVFLGDGRAEIGVGIREGHQRQGLGSAVARATIARCLELGLAPEWGCMYNPASGAMAASLGFSPLPDLPFWLVRPQE